MICPNCQIDAAITEQLYGALYTCGGCQAVYFINFEGQPEFGEVSTDILTDMISEPAAVEISPGPDMQEAPPMNNDYASSLEPQIDSVDMVDFDNKLDEQFVSQAEDSGLQTPQAEPDEIKSNSFTDIAKEISDFGNTEVQLGSLNYDLKITGLDTQETMLLFKEAIEDSKFGWDANELLRTIKNGQIKLERLSPVKAYILAKRLQFLDIEKHWKQNAMS